MSPVWVTLQEKKTSIITLLTYHDQLFNYPIITASKLPLIIDCSAHIKIIDPLLAVTSIRDIDSMVDAICKSQLRNVFSTLDLDEIITTQATLQRKLLASINEDLTGYGVSCVGFTLTRVQLPDNIQSAVTKITSEQMQQRCAIIEAQTKQKVLHIDLALERQAQVTHLQMARLQHQALLQKLHSYRQTDPNFDLNQYFRNKFKSEAYSKCNSVTLLQGNPDNKGPSITPVTQVT